MTRISRPARAQELVVIRAGFEAPDGLGKRPGGFGAPHTVVGQQVYSRIEERGDPSGCGMQAYMVGRGRSPHGYQHALQVAGQACQTPSVRADSANLGTTFIALGRCTVARAARDA